MEEYLSKRAQTNSYNQAKDHIEDSFRFLEQHFDNKQEKNQKLPLNEQFPKGRDALKICNKYRIAAHSNYAAAYKVCKEELIALYNKKPNQTKSA